MSPAESTLPLISELRPVPDCIQVFERLSRLPHCLFLDSAMQDQQLGRYSFITADPYAYITAQADGSDGLETLARHLTYFRQETSAELPPFQGGAAGLFGYDLNRSVDSIRPNYAFDVSCQGTVPEAIIAFLDSESFEDAVRNAVSLGGDSDTLACITGGIAGAFYSVPDNIRNEVQNRLTPDLLKITLEFCRKHLD